MLPDRTISYSERTTHVRLNAPTGAWCSLTTSGGEVKRLLSRLNAPTGAWCSLTHKKTIVITIKDGSQCTYRCVVLPDYIMAQSSEALFCVSMHLQVRGAP